MFITLHSVRGFCDEDVTIDLAYGNYTWPETKVGESVELSCVYSFEDDSAMARRGCFSNGEWDMSPDFTECLTRISLMYEMIAQVSFKQMWHIS